MRGTSGRVRRWVLAGAVAGSLVAGTAPGDAATTATAARPTAWAALNHVIAAIPSYEPGSTRWVVSLRFDFWATADWYRDVIYVSPLVPKARLYDVAVHEWSHLLSVRAYDGNVRRARRAMNRWFGGHGLVGAERAADCMAIVQGARWTHYTSCRNRDWRHGARRLVAGRQLKLTRRS
jgi:hypothetical protein